MKEAIEKVIENGFDYTIMNEPQERIEFEGFSKQFMIVKTHDDPPRRDFSLEELIFSTDFVDKLVGRGEKVIKCYSPKGADCDSTKCNADFKTCCHKIFFYIKTADYCKQQLAIMKTGKERIEYINKLAGIK